MPTAIQELVKVTSVGPYGIKVGNEYYRFGKKLGKYNFQQGHTYSIDIGMGKGKDGSPAKYINAVLDDIGGSAVPELNPSINQAAVPAALDNRPRRAGFDKPLTEYDLRLQVQISLAGLLQAAMQGVATHVSSVDKLIAESQRVAEAQTAFIQAKVNEAFPVK